MRDRTDADLVAAATAGDVHAFAALSWRYRDRYSRFAVRMVGTRDDAEDVMQSAFIRAYRALEDCRDPSRFGAWLYQIVANECRQLRPPTRAQGTAHRPRRVGAGCRGGAGGVGAERNARRRPIRARSARRRPARSLSHEARRAAELRRDGRNHRRRSFGSQDESETRLREPQGIAGGGIRCLTTKWTSATPSLTAPLARSAPRSDSATTSSGCSSKGFAPIGRFAERLLAARDR